MAKFFVLVLCFITASTGAAFAEAENCPSADTVRDGVLPKGWKFSRSPHLDELAMIDRLGRVRVAISLFGNHLVDCSYIRSDLSVVAHAVTNVHDSGDLESRVKAANYKTDYEADDVLRFYWCFVDINTDCRF